MRIRPPREWNRSGPAQRCDYFALLAHLLLDSGPRDCALGVLRARDVSEERAEKEHDSDGMASRRRRTLHMTDPRPPRSPPVALSEPIAAAVAASARAIDDAVDSGDPPALARRARAGVARVARAPAPGVRRDGRALPACLRRCATRRAAATPARRGRRRLDRYRHGRVRLGEPRVRAHRRPSRHDAGPGEARRAGRDDPLHARRQLARPAGGRDAPIAGCASSRSASPMPSSPRRSPAGSRARRSRRPGANHARGSKRWSRWSTRLPDPR